MGVVTWEYYSATWLGEAPETAFPRLDRLAEDMIANVTRQADYTRLTADQQTLWQKAVCAQIDYLKMCIRDRRWSVRREGLALPRSSLLISACLMPVFSASCFCVMPVSYTHLDVYKRQRLHR